MSAVIFDQSIASGVENKLTSLESRLDSLATQLKVSAPAVPSGLETENGISDEELIKSVVQEELHKKTEEERDSENRRRNIIIYRVPEKKMDNISESKESDITLLTISWMVFSIWSYSRLTLREYIDWEAGQKVIIAPCWRHLKI